MKYVVDEIHKDDKKLDIICAKKIGNNDIDLCLTDMKFIDRDIQGVQYECPKCGNLVVITL